ncbi:NAD-dependent epimerase/dehydratase family protein [Marinifilum sp. N1E240]|uniref:NAD-dependent epimerase/dehydratase family protein n=1 Tax=Marinifilum sp. N1E240 TaxID=2608082 RepID=UPI00128C8195|nr:NAD-dependent epimerase/dehydratase family protein [Marinifilum sp. N1E240]MPQ46871.1 NAD-dependent epimerase/dehydratase family protein [Marinifilum sp. N1E240]
MKNVLITGASGMVGNIILKHCLKSLEIAKVTSFVRRFSDNKHPKLNEVLVKDFKDYSPYQHEFQNIDVVYFCIGVYTGAVSDLKFREITVDYTNSFVDVLKIHSPKANFCFLSGGGADRTEKSRMSFAKYKGIAENYFFSTLDNAFTFRPAYIYPVEKREEPNFSYKLSRLLYPLIKMFGENVSITSEELAYGMFKIGIEASGQKIYENRDILSSIKL